MLPLVDPPPETRLEATLPRSPEMTATDAFAGAWAVAAETSVAAATATAIDCSDDQTHSESVPTPHLAATCL